MNKTATILDGQGLANAILKKLAQQIRSARVRPGLAAVLVGSDPASGLYIRLKEKAAQAVGINFHKYLCNEQCYQDISQQELIQLIKFLNQDQEVDGILVQLPLPKKYDSRKVLQAIEPQKDVDGFLTDQTGLIPPPIAAIISLLQATHQDLSELSTLIIGKADIFLNSLDKYLQQELPLKKITRRKSIPQNAKNFDIIIIALGQAKALKKSQVKQGAIVIDVGINKTPTGKVVGDVDPKVKEQAAFLSPVPGGVGPLTVAHLLENTYKLSQ